MSLSKHFTLEEMVRSQTAARLGIFNFPDPWAVSNLERLAQLLEEVRSLFGGKPVIITSGYRCTELNRRIGSRDSSQHTKGCAADFRVSGVSIADTVRAIYESDIVYDQLIEEFNDGAGGWVHISVPNDPNGLPRKQALVINHEGARTYA